MNLHSFKQGQKNVLKFVPSVDSVPYWVSTRFGRTIFATDSGTVLLPLGANLRENRPFHQHQLFCNLLSTNLILITNFASSRQNAATI